MLDESTALVDGYTSYFSFSKKRSGYSGKVSVISNLFKDFSTSENVCEINVSLQSSITKRSPL